MWTFITQLLVTLVLLGFFLVSCQNVMHIVKGSLCFVLKHIHQELDKELGESEGVSDDEETISTRVVRRRVFLKVTARQEAGGRAEGTAVYRGSGWGKQRTPNLSPGLATALEPEQVCGTCSHGCAGVAWETRLRDLGGLFWSFSCPQQLWEACKAHSGHWYLWKGLPHCKGLLKDKSGALLPLSEPPFVKLA